MALPSPVIRLLDVQIDSSTIGMHRPVVCPCNKTTLVGASNWNRICNDVECKLIDLFGYGLQSPIDTVYSGNLNGLSAVPGKPPYRANPFSYLAFFAISVHRDK